MWSSLLSKARVNRTKKTETHAPNKARERWNDKGEINKGPTTGNGVGASSWRFELEIFQVGYPVDIHTERERKRKKERERQTDRQTDRQR